MQLANKEAVMQNSDIVVVSTLSKETLVSFVNAKKGQLVISTAHSIEVSKDFVISAETYVDYYQTAQNEFGPVKAAIDDGFDFKSLAGDLTELVSGKKKGRGNDDEIIMFQSLGVMCENLAVVEYLYNRIYNL